MFSRKIKQEVLKKYLNGIPPSQLMIAYGIRGSATIYQWLEQFKLFGIAGLENSSKKTFYDYSFKMRVIKWRQAQQASFPMTASHFKIKNPVTIWDWERKLVAGRLISRKRRSSDMRNVKKSTKTIKQLQAENELLRVKVAYLEKVNALVQKKKSQIKKKPR